MKSDSLSKYLYLSFAASIVTIFLKFYAYYLTGSLGLYSDMLESLVNVFAALFAIVMLHISEKPADCDHEYGHSKAEYFSSAIEGTLIIIAAIIIFCSTVSHIFTPRTVENINSGLFALLLATIINLAVGMLLVKKGKRHNSMTLEADGKHLMSDVWLSVAIFLGLLLVKITGLMFLDPLIAIAVSVYIFFCGYKLVFRSANGLMDVALEEYDLNKIKTYLKTIRTEQTDYHSLLTRQAGRRRFVSLHLLVPGSWSIKKGHDYADEIEKHIENMFEEPVSVTTHIEPIEDPLSFADIGIDRKK